MTNREGADLDLCGTPTLTSRLVGEIVIHLNVVILIVGYNKTLNMLNCSKDYKDIFTL